MGSSVGVLALVACGEDATISDVPTEDGGTTGKDGRAASSSGSSGTEEDSGDGDRPDGSKPKDAGTKDAGDTCIGEYEPPDLDGPGPCGTDGFGEDAVAFGPVDIDGGTTYVGTNLVDGIYDAVTAERSSGVPGSWRETFVVKGDRFTRTRQIDSLGNGPGPISYRAGKLVYTTVGGAQLLKFTYDCAQTGNDDVDAGVDNLPSDAVVSSDCSARYRYGVSGIRVTFKRR
jgi:hypothetical protein